MAEGDSIHRLAKRLSAQLAGARIVASDFRVPHLATSDVSGCVVDAVRPVGKHLLWRMHDDAGERLTLHTALRMSGSWRVMAAGTCLPRSADDEARLILLFQDGRCAVALNMPVVGLLATADEPSVIGHLGPDLCAESFDMDEALCRFASQPDRPLIEALLDQRNACGIGNLWAVEVCFLRGEFPWHRTGDVDVEAALTLARKMMRYSVVHEGGMMTTGNKRRGETHWVYGRYNRPCRRCGTPIAFRPGGSSPWDRETWWCPSCQPTQGPVPPAPYVAPGSHHVRAARGSC